jgi:uncharacterized membrane protein YkoI
MKRIVALMAGALVLCEPNHPSTETEKEAVANASKTKTGDVKISEEKAKELALDAVKGTITEFELEEENGNIYYEVEVTDQKKNETDVLVDANSGNVMSEKDVDHDDDHDDENDTDHDD